MRATGIVAVVVAALLAGACVPETKSFLSGPGKIDRRVLGTWYFLEDNGSSTIVDIRAGKDKLLRLVWLGFKPDDAINDKQGPARWLLYSGFTTRLGGRRYINLQLLKANWVGRPPKRFIMRYWYSKKSRLRFAFMST